MSIIFFVVQNFKEAISKKRLHFVMLTIVAVCQNNVLKLPKIFLFLISKNISSHMFTCFTIYFLFLWHREELNFSSQSSKRIQFSQFLKIYIIEKWFLIDIYVSSLVPLLTIWYCDITYLYLSAVMLYLLCKKQLWFYDSILKAFKFTILAFLERTIHFSTGANFGKTKY